MKSIGLTEEGKDVKIRGKQEESRQVQEEEEIKRVEVRGKEKNNKRRKRREELR